MARGATSPAADAMKRQRPLPLGGEHAAGGASGVRPQGAICEEAARWCRIPKVGGGSPQA